MQTAKIETITKEKFEGYVYNLKTTNEEYVVNNVVVHNCPHLWDIRHDKVAREACPDLWMGG